MLMFCDICVRHDECIDDIPDGGGLSGICASFETEDGNFPEGYVLHSCGKCAFFDKKRYYTCAKHLLAPGRNCLACEDFNDPRNMAKQLTLFDNCLTMEKQNKVIELTTQIEKLSDQREKLALELLGDLFEKEGFKSMISDRTLRDRPDLIKNFSIKYFGDAIWFVDEDEEPVLEILLCEPVESQIGEELKNV